MIQLKSLIGAPNASNANDISIIPSELIQFVDAADI
jgi:hypothetical protein